VTDAIDLEIMIWKCRSRFKRDLRQKIPEANLNLYSCASASQKAGCANWQPRAD
jgi:hypothetical protein